MNTWPTTDEVKQVLDIEGDVWDTTIERVTFAAIGQVQGDVGDWGDDDQPDEALAQAALRLAELMGLRPDAAASSATDPTYQMLLKGHRRKFGIA